MVGTTIAHYQITAKLGQGGMGEVYLAKDGKLDREVAIKILPEEFAAHPERMARFEREAKSLAKLNHPNIASIYGFDQHESKWFLVLELVDGETLAQHIAKGPLKLEEALRIFQQIAEALEAAHDKNIVHRDLKPANLKIDSQGRVKVLDFGLAKARAEKNTTTDTNTTLSDSMAPTITSEFTMPGKVMGTAAYMSPEQSRGQEVDKRTDVWAFGCCLYEALTGRRPFRGKTTSDLLAEILKVDPDWTAIPAETPREVVTLLRRCLEKEPRRRLRDIGDIAITLEETSNVTRLESTSTQFVTHPEPNDEPGPIKKIFQTIGSVVLALGFAYALFDLFLGIDLFSSKGSHDSGEAIRSITVLPFKNLKPGDIESQYLAETLQSKLKEQLGNLDQLVIKSGTSPDVDAVIDGTFVQVADTYQVTVEMTEKATDVVMLTNGFNDSVTNLFTLQNEMAIVIAETILKNLSDQERNKIAIESNIHPQAYIAYRQGLEYYDLFTFEGFARAEEKFKEAIAMDPAFADPYMHRAANIWVPPIWGGTTETAEEAWDRVAPIEAQARQILGPDGNLESIAWMFLVRDWNWDLSLEQIRKVISTRPQSAADGYHAYATYLSYVEGRHWDGLRMVEQSLELDPDRINFLHAMALIHIHNGENRLAISVFDKIPESKKRWAHLDNRARALVNLRKFSAAIDTMEQARELSNRHPATLMATARTLARIGGHEAEAHALIQEVRTSMENGIYFPEAWFAESYYHLGEKEKALRSLEKGFEQKGTWQMLELRLPRYLRLFSDEPRYWKLVEKMKFPPLPSEHPFYRKEQEMRFGKGENAVLTTTANSERNIHHLAVLPFKMVGEASVDDGLSDGMALELIHTLRIIDDLNVTSHGQAQRFRDSTKPVIEIGKELKVDHLLNGYITRVGNHLRINAELINITDGSSPGNWQYDEKADNLLLARSSIAQQVAEALQITLGNAEIQRLKAKTTVNDQAYEYYLKGKAAWNRRSISEFEKAIEYFDHALALDSNFALAYAGLAAVHSVWTIYDSERKDAAFHISEAKRFAENARSLDPLLAESYAVLGYLRFQYDWDWIGAEKEFQVAIKLNPKSAIANHWYADLHYCLGRFSDSAEMSRRAIALNPSPVNRSTYGFALVYDRDRRELIRQVNDWIDQDPHFKFYYGILTTAHILEGNFELAMNTVQRMSSPTVLVDKDRISIYKAWILAEQGRTSEAQSLLEQVQKTDATDIGRAQVMYVLNQDEEAIELFGGVLNDKGIAMEAIPYIPYWRRLHGNPRFRALLQKIKLDPYFPDPSASPSP